MGICRSEDLVSLEDTAAAAGKTLRGKLRDCAELSRQVQGALEVWSQRSAALEQEIKALAVHPGDAPGDKGTTAGAAGESAWQELEALAEARNGLRELIAEGEGEVSSA